MAYRTNEELLLSGVQNTINKGFAPNGCVMITGTAVTTANAGTYFAVQFVTACTPTTLTITNSTTVVSVTHVAGTIIYGDIVAITAASADTYILYKN
mgnify:CR=1 FL=1